MSALVQDTKALCAEWRAQVRRDARGHRTLTVTVEDLLLVANTFEAIITRSSEALDERDLRILQLTENLRAAERRNYRMRRA